MQTRRRAGKSSSSVAESPSSSGKKKKRTPRKSNKKQPENVSEQTSSAEDETSLEDSSLNVNSFNNSTHESVAADITVDQTKSVQPDSASSVTESDGSLIDSTDNNSQLLDNDKNKSSNFTVITILAVFAIAAIFCVYFPSNNTKVENKVDQFMKGFNRSKSEFPNQHKKLWRTSKVTLYNHQKSNDNKQPAVLMLAATEESFTAAGCLASKLAQAYSHNCSDKLVISGEDFKKLDANGAKVAIDTIITEKFAKGSCAVVIERFDLIPAAATTVFYQFCENDNAPFKNVAIIFTLQINPGSWSSPIKEFSDLPPKLWDETVERFLVDSLQSRDPVIMTTDMIGGLLSRITPAVAWVRKEEWLPC